MPRPALRQPRSVGTAAVSVRTDDTGATRIADLRQSGALKLVFPQTHRPDLEAISVNTGGGIAGGDAFDMRAEVRAGATLTITTQAAERAYKAQTGEVGRMTTQLDVADGGRLHWLPQEMILFDGAALNRRLHINLDGAAKLLMVEPLVFGRAAMGERLHNVTFTDRIRILRDGSPIYIDGIDLHGDAATRMARPATAQGAGAMVSLVMVDPDAPRFLEPLRNHLPGTGGASMLAPDVLTLRLVATDSLELRRTLVPVLDLLTNNTLPLSWRL